MEARTGEKTRNVEVSPGGVVVIVPVGKYWDTENGKLKPGGGAGGAGGGGGGSGVEPVPQLIPKAVTPAQSCAGFPYVPAPWPTGTATLTPTGPQTDALMHVAEMVLLTGPPPPPLPELAPLPEPLTGPPPPPLTELAPLPGPGTVTVPPPVTATGGPPALPAEARTLRGAAESKNAAISEGAASRNPPRGDLTRVTVQDGAARPITGE